MNYTDEQLKARRTELIDKQLEIFMEDPSASVAAMHMNNIEMMNILISFQQSHRDILAMLENVALKTKATCDLLERLVEKTEEKKLYSPY